MTNTKRPSREFLALDTNGSENWVAKAAREQNEFVASFNRTFAALETIAKTNPGISINSAASQL